MADAEVLKKQGNELFASGEFLKAAAVYSQAIKLDPENAVLYSNRSAALLKLKKVSKATEDAERCIALRPDWEKGYFRKGAILEDQQALPEALEVYQAALKLCPDSRELAQKVKTLAKVVKQHKQAPITAGPTTAAAVAAPGGPAPAPKATAVAAPTAPPPATAPAGAVYEDLGSEDVEEYLQVLAADIQESGTDFIPAVHLLPGPDAEESDEQQQHVRAAGAWDNSQTLDGFVGFLRSAAERVDAQAVTALVPKPAVGYPQTWLKKKWPCGQADGVLAQLESRQGVRKLWFVPVHSRAPGTPTSLSVDDFGILPRVLRG